MTADPKQPRVLVLRCRACRAALPAASNDVAFRCPQCGRAWEIDPTGLNERPSLYVAPPAVASHPLLYLPYWSFSVSVFARPTSVLPDAGQLTARDRAAQISHAWVSAYAVYRPTYVGEWGLVYTRMQPDWETRRGHGPEAPGAAISSRDAKKIAHHYVLAEIDRAADIGSLDLHLEVGDPELWAIPCYDIGAQIRCPWTRAELPAAALDDLSEIRRETVRREA
ncbi:MAG: hypothetical protein AMS25_09695 [Gemmatimonas sp. SM23_52]|nr:MAG: hypothetical protein AMS25_09695 [Gemmatimonas sp. SM23_52]